MKIYFRLLCHLIFLLVLSFGLGLNAQESVFQEEPIRLAQKAISLYENAIYPAAYDAFLDVLEEKQILHTLDPLIITKIKWYKASALIRQRDLKCEEEMLAFIKNEKANPYTNMAYMELAEFYFYNQDYANAIHYFGKVELSDLEDDMYSEMIFKKAYSHFLRKDFEITKSELKKILHLQNEYSNSAIYYNGMSQYFTEELDEAVISFKKLKNSAEYKNRIPYYIAQIYFKQEKYSELIDYGTEILETPSIKNVKEIRGLLGQAYFLQDEYKQAITHLSYYVENTEILRAEDFYQLGFSYYKTDQHAKAIPHFIEIANVNSELGQNANNYLADSYLKIENKEAARIAFKRTSEMNFIPDLAEESLFNYGKLSAEMQLDREAMNTLKKISSGSPYYDEAQQILSHILGNTTDFSQAISFIEALEIQSPVVLKSYQKLCYLYAMQFLVDQNEPMAIVLLNKANMNQLDNQYTALTFYRLADIDHSRGEYQRSITRLFQYFTLAKTGIKLPSDADLAYANYLQAYNYLKMQQFIKARRYFEDAANLFNNQIGKGKLRMDALLRAGDCYFNDNAYADAIKFYNDAIELKRSGADYALYQRGMIQGLLGKPYEKIVTMDELYEKHPTSPLADFSLYQNGKTLLAIGEASEADKSFKEILKKFKNSTLRNKSMLKLGLISFNQGDLLTAISYYKDLFKYNPNAKESQEAMLALEEIYVDNLGNPDEFFDFIEKHGGFKMSGFEKDSISFRAGEIPYENGEYDKAILSYSNYIERYNNGFNRIAAHFRRGESYFLGKKYKNALNDYEYVISQGNNEYFLFSLEKAAIISYNLLEDYKKSFDYYSLFEELSIDDDKRYAAQLGALRSAAKMEDEKALEYMSKRLINNPLLKLNDKALAMFYLGKINFGKKAFDLALSQLEEVQSLSDNVFTAEARFLISKIHFEKGEYFLSEEKLRLGIVESKPYPEWVARSLMLLSDIFVKNNDLLQAKASLEAVIENFKTDDEILAVAKSKLEQVVSLQEKQNRVEDDRKDGDLEMESIKEN